MCVARKALGDRTVPTDAMNLAPVVVRRKARQACRTAPGRLRVTGWPPADQIALSIIWVS